MSRLAHNIPLSILFLILLLLPFFEGGETAIGLLILHTLTLLLFCIHFLARSRIWIPRFAPYFLPFLLSLLVSSILAPYRYAAFLQFWDYCIAGILCIGVYSVFREDELNLSKFLWPVFLAGSAALLLSVLLEWLPLHRRMRGSFVNPNDFSIYSLLLIFLGVFLVERESATRRKILALVALAFLVMMMAFASSRAVFLAAAVFLAIYLWKRRHQRIILLAGVSFFVITGFMLLFRFSHFDDPFQYYRLKIWKHSLRGILQDPYLGIGLNMLPYRAAQFNFPADVEVGRYARVATTADNQYLQILAESGFLGLFTFLIGWVALYFDLRRSPPQFLVLTFAIISISIVAVFALPLNNTAVLFLFVVISVIPMVYQEFSQARVIEFAAPGRIILSVTAFFLLLFAVLVPFGADYEYRQALKAKSTSEVEVHLNRAVTLNPFQPYYTFQFIRKFVHSNPEVPPEKWLALVQSINESIRLNPWESDFYVTKAVIFRRLAEQTRNPAYYFEAISAYQSAMDCAPYNVFLRAEFAYFLSVTDHESQAEAELKKILEMEPAYLGARLLLVRVLAERGNLEAARKEYQILEGLEDRYRTYNPGARYVTLLLRVDPELKKEIEQRIFHASGK